MIARELTEFFAGFAPNGAPGAAAAGRPHLPLERERLLPARLLGGDPLRRRRLLRGPGLRPRDARGGLGEGVPPRARRSPRARLRPGRVHAALLRRVPRPARDERARGAAAPARGRRARCARDARWMRERGLARAASARAGLARSVAAPRRSPAGVGARLARRAASRRACSARCRSRARRDGAAPPSCDAAARRAT